MECVTMSGQVPGMQLCSVHRHGFLHGGYKVPSDDEGQQDHIQAGLAAWRAGEDEQTPLMPGHDLVSQMKIKISEPLCSSSTFASLISCVYSSQLTMLFDAVSVTSHRTYILDRVCSW
jgi:hypothetical protein